LRKYCAAEMISRDPPGIAVGGLSGGESKVEFMKSVSVSTENLPRDKPRYLMGVGYAIDMMMAVALGIDMFDCVFPTRTARFGTALIRTGTHLPIKRTVYAQDLEPIDKDCDCTTCRRGEGYSRSYLHFLFRSNQAVGCHLLTVHNLRFQMRWMESIRTAIKEQRFDKLIKENLDSEFGSKDNYPDWIKTGLQLANLEELLR